MIPVVRVVTRLVEENDGVLECTDGTSHKGFRNKGENRICTLKQAEVYMKVVECFMEEIRKISE